MAEQMPIDLAKLSNEEFKEFVNKFDVIFCDCDGVLWSFRTPIAGARDAITALQNLGKKIYLVTNNSHMRREDVLEKSTKMGYKMTVDDILSSTYITAHYLKKIGFDKKAYVIAHEELGMDLDEVGIKHIGIGPDPIEGSLYEHILKRYSLDKDVGAVIVGFDRHFSFIKLCKAVNYLKNKDIKFYATNPEGFFDLPQFNFLLPEVGCFIGAIEAATNRKPEIIGKPTTHICEIVAENGHTFDSSRALVIGDTLQTDVAFGKNAGYSTLFVGTGSSKLKEVEEIVEKINNGDDSEELKKLVPHYYISGLEAFYKKFQEVFN